MIKFLTFSTKWILKEIIMAKTQVISDIKILLKEK